MPLTVVQPGERLRLLCLGAHSDDIEIGAGATILGWIAAGAQVEVVWTVLSAPGARAGEAEASAAAFLAGAADRRIELHGFEDGLFPQEVRGLKAALIDIRDRFRPDVILTHRRDDAHQDHRTVGDLTWNIFRNHMILEYEIPKWDGDLGRPNVYAPATAALMERKIALLDAHFGSQRSKDWFDGETFRGLARLRGMECRAPERFAEGFFVSKAVFAVGG